MKPDAHRRYEAHGRVAPSRGRGLKHGSSGVEGTGQESPLHGRAAVVGNFETIYERVRAADEELAGL